MNSRHFDEKVHFLRHEDNELTLCSREALWLRKTDNPNYVTCKQCNSRLQKGNKDAKTK